MYAVAISVLIAIALASLILFSGFSSIEIKQLLLTDKVNDNSTSGLALLMSDQSLIATGDSRTVDLYDEGNDSVLLMKHTWGVFDLLLSKAFTKGYSRTQIGLCGSGFDSLTAFSLYLADAGKSLSLCGRTEINGHCYLPAAGLKRGYIEGESFAGNNLINGVMDTSQSEVPAIDKKLLDQIRLKFSGNYFQIGDSVINADEQGINDTLFNSFEKKTIILNSKGKLNLSDVNYAGNVIIVSSESIHVSSSSVLQEVLLFAPKIYVEEDFSGSIQAFASDSLWVGKGCRLSYPSVIGIVRTSSSPQNVYALIQADAEISGIILACQEGKDLKNSVQVTIEKDVKLTGQLYSTGLIDLRGTVHGMVICGGFILNTASSVYQNMLLDAIIDISKLPGSFSGIPLEDKRYSKRIVKWLQ